MARPRNNRGGNGGIGGISNGNYGNSPDERVNRLKQKREGDKKKFIAQGLMTDPDKSVNLEDRITVRGICQDMCPEYERAIRIKENDLFPQECTAATANGPPSMREADETLMVKRFRRAAAGNESQYPSDLRPPAVLERTMAHLVDHVMGDKSDADELLPAYNFLWDRTRAIRNDFSIQIQPGGGSRQFQANPTYQRDVEDLHAAMRTHERIIRFHLLTLHALAGRGEPKSTRYDPPQDWEQCLKALNSLMSYYDEQNGIISKQYDEFVALDLLSHIDTDYANDYRTQVQRLTRTGPYTQLACQIYESATLVSTGQGSVLHAKNIRKFWHYLDAACLSPAMALMMEKVGTTVNKRYVYEICQAYCRTSKHPVMDFSPEVMREHLDLQTVEEVELFLSELGMTIEDKPNEPGKRYIPLASFRNVSWDTFRRKALTRVQYQHASVNRFLEESYGYWREFVHDNTVNEVYDPDNDATPHPAVARFHAFEAKYSATPRPASEHAPASLPGPQKPAGLNPFAGTFTPALASATTKANPFSKKPSASVAPVAPNPFAAKANPFVVTQSSSSSDDDEDSPLFVPREVDSAGKGAGALLQPQVAAPNAAGLAVASAATVAPAPVATTMAAAVPVFSQAPMAPAFNWSKPASQPSPFPSFATPASVPPRDVMSSGEQTSGSSWLKPTGPASSNPFLPAVSVAPVSPAPVSPKTMGPASVEADVPARSPAPAQAASPAEVATAGLSPPVAAATQPATPAASTPPSFAPMFPLPTFIPPPMPSNRPPPGSYRFGDHLPLIDPSETVGMIETHVITATKAKRHAECLDHLANHFAQDKNGLIDDAVYNLTADIIREEVVRMNQEDAAKDEALRNMPPPPRISARQRHKMRKAQKRAAEEAAEECQTQDVEAQSTNMAHQLVSASNRFPAQPKRPRLSSPSSAVIPEVSTTPHHSPPFPPQFPYLPASAQISRGQASTMDLFRIAPGQENGKQLATDAGYQRPAATDGHKEDDLDVAVEHPEADSGEDIADGDEEAPQLPKPRLLRYNAKNRYFLDKARRLAPAKLQAKQEAIFRKCESLRASASGVTSRDTSPALSTQHASTHRVRPYQESILPDLATAQGSHHRATTSLDVPRLFQSTTTRRVSFGQQPNLSRSEGETEPRMTVQDILAKAKASLAEIDAEKAQREEEARVRSLPKTYPEPAYKSRPPTSNTELVKKKRAEWARLAKEKEGREKEGRK